VKIYTELRATKQLSDAQVSFDQVFPDEISLVGKLYDADADAETVRLGISMPAAKPALSLDDEAARRTVPPALEHVRAAPALDDFAAMPRAERATCMNVAARKYAREVARDKAHALAAKVRAAIKGAFIVMSRAVRQPRSARHPAASRAGPNAASSSGKGDGGGGQDDDAASHIPAPDNLSPWPTPNLPPWASGVADERHSPDAWDWLRKVIAAGGGAWEKPYWSAGLSDQLAQLDKLKGARDRRREANRLDQATAKPLRQTIGPNTALAQAAGAADRLVSRERWHERRSRYCLEFFHPLAQRALDRRWPVRRRQGAARR
jgi:hypothetical protein